MPARDLPVGASLVIPGAELSWTAVRASGPGGQNVNKVASKIELRFDFEHSSVLGGGVRHRLRGLAENRLDADGRIVITSQVTRDQARNLEAARSKLADLIEQALTPPKPRKPTKPSRAARQRRLDSKQHQSAKKRERRVRD
jgi:ribosome-associated protein